MQMLLLLLALAAPVQTRIVNVPDGAFLLEVPSEWDWSEEKTLESGGDVAWLALAPHWEDGFVVIASKRDPFDVIAAWHTGQKISKLATEHLKDGSSRITYAARDKKETLYGFAYAVKGVLLAAESSKNEEPAALKRAAVSLRWFAGP